MFVLKGGSKWRDRKKGSEGEEIKNTTKKEKEEKRRQGEKKGKEGGRRKERRGGEDECGRVILSVLI